MHTVYENFDLNLLKRPALKSDTMLVNPSSCMVSKTVSNT